MGDRYFLDAPLRRGLVTLEGPEAHHLAVVSRVRAGDSIYLFNGDGRQYPARVMEVARRRVAVEVLGEEVRMRELGFGLEVAAPLPKGDRGQFLIEKLTEIGVTRYVPLRTHRSVTHPAEARRDRLNRYVIEACKQCGRNTLMEIAPTAPWETYCAGPDLPAARILGHVEAPDGAPAGGAWPVVSDGRVVAVGPEGGFTPDEVALAMANRWTPVGLGPRVLRVETAALVLAVLASRPTPGQPL